MKRIMVGLFLISSSVYSAQNPSDRVSSGRVQNVRSTYSRSLPGFRRVFSTQDELRIYEAAQSFVKNETKGPNWNLLVEKVQQGQFVFRATGKPCVKLNKEQIAAIKADNQ